MENPIKLDDLGVPLFLETPIYPTRKSQAPFFCEELVKVPQIGNHFLDFLGGNYDKKRLKPPR